MSGVWYATISTGCGPDSPVNGRPKPRKMKYKESLVARILPGGFHEIVARGPGWDRTADGNQIETNQVMILKKNT